MHLTLAVGAIARFGIEEGDSRYDVLQNDLWRIYMRQNIEYFREKYKKYSRKYKMSKQ